VFALLFFANLDHELARIRVNLDLTLFIEVNRELIVKLFDLRLLVGEDLLGTRDTRDAVLLSLDVHLLLLIIGNHRLHLPNKLGSTHTI